MNRNFPIGQRISAQALAAHGLALILFFAVGASSTPAENPSLSHSPAELVNEVVVNELADRLHHGKWMYRVEKRDWGRNVTGMQVETKYGPLFRTIAINSRPLTLAERRNDEDRIQALLQDANRQQKLKRDYEEDERKLQDLLRVLPSAFLYDFDAIDGNVVRLRFHPNPNYAPPNYEARVAHDMSGMLLIDIRQKRLVRLSGQLSDGVDFGYGLLGHIEKGGTIEIGRLQVSPSQWKTSLINVRLSGRIVFFKTIRKQEFQLRSDFRGVPENLSLTDARKLLFN